MTNCSKEENENVKSEVEILLTSGKWNRQSMNVNPKVLLPKQDGSGEFFTISNLMEIESLVGYDQNFEGFYTFKNDGHYSFTPKDDLNNSLKGTYSLKENIINVVNSKDENLTYTILGVTNSNLTMEVPLIFFGQETTVKIICNK
ncbi:lipocalin family protein [Maribacter ulvicola]|nr:lipocalin family protein [Maribacter ulvicola]